MKICQNFIIEKGFIFYSQNKTYSEFEVASSPKEGDYLVNLQTGDTYTYKNIEMPNLSNNVCGWELNVNFKKRLMSNFLYTIEIPSFIFDIPVISLNKAFKSFSCDNITNICNKIIESHFFDEVKTLNILESYKKNILKHQCFQKKLKSSQTKFINDVYNVVDTFLKNINIPETVLFMDECFSGTPLKQLPILPPNLISINNMCSFSLIEFVGELPKNIKFAKRAFYNCKNLIAVILEDNFDVIDEDYVMDIFANCKNLLYFADTMDLISEKSLSNCVNLKYRPYELSNSNNIFPERVGYDKTYILANEIDLTVLDKEILEKIKENARKMTEKETLFENIDKFISDNIEPLDCLDDFYKKSTIIS